MLLENFADRSAHRELPQAGTLHLPTGAIEFGAPVLGPAQAPEPGRAVIDDVGYTGQRLDVIDDGGLAEQAHHDWKRRLRPRGGALALERIKKSGFIAANVTAAAEMQMHFQAVARAEDILSQVVTFVSFRDGARQP